MSIFSLKDHFQEFFSVIPETNIQSKKTVLPERRYNYLASIASFVLEWSAGVSIALFWLRPLLRFGRRSRRSQLGPGEFLWFWQGGRWHLLVVPGVGYHVPLGDGVEAGTGAVGGVEPGCTGHVLHIRHTVKVGMMVKILCQLFNITTNPHLVILLLRDKEGVGLAAGDAVPVAGAVGDQGAPEGLKVSGEILLRLINSLVWARRQETCYRTPLVPISTLNSAGLVSKQTQLVCGWLSTKANKSSSNIIGARGESPEKGCYISQLLSHKSFYVINTFTGTWEGTKHESCVSFATKLNFKFSVV